MKKILGRIERTVVGSPRHRSTLTGLALPTRRALPLLGADGLSSAAYAPDEIVLMLAFAGTAGLIYSPWVALGIAAMLLIVVGTYRYNISQIAEQGDYLLVYRRLGPIPATVLGASSMVDFLLTVAVSAAAGSGYIAAVFPQLSAHTRWVAAALVLVVMFLCLRGWHFMGRIAQVLTYTFLALLAAVIGVGLVENMAGTLPAAESSAYYIIPRTATDSLLTGFGLTVLLARAFSSGAIAMSGVATVNNSVKFFARPKKHNAAQTLMLTGLLSAFILVSLLYLVRETGAKIVQEPHRYLMVNGELAGESFRQKPLLYQVADAVFAGSLMPVLLSFATVGILLMAAATAFLGFPVLTSRIAEFRYLPMQMNARTSANLYGYSVILLAATAIVLVVIFGADVNSLIQLYIVGVLTSMVLTQTAVTRHRTQQLRLTLDRFKRRTIIRGVFITGLGLAATAVSLLAVLLTKLAQGAWATVLLILTTAGIMLVVRKHYTRIDSDLALGSDQEALAKARRLPSRTHAIVYVPRVRKPAVRAVAYARAARPTTIEAVTLNVVEEHTRKTVQQWEELGIPVPLTVIDSPYRDYVQPIVDYVRGLAARSPRSLLVVYLPDYLVKHWWERLIHRRTAARLARALKHERGLIVATVPWRVGEEEDIVFGYDTVRSRRKDNRG